MDSYPAPLMGPAPMTGTDPVGEEALFALPIAPLYSLWLIAFESQTRPHDPTWVANALSDLAPFPNLPPSLANVRNAPSPLGRRSRDDDDDGNNDDDGNDDSDGGNGGSRRSRLAVALRGGPRGSRVRVPSPLQQVSSSDTHVATKVRKPHLPFCTQACLLGLAQDGPLDRKCPNVQLHRQAQADEDASTHPITKSQLMELVRQQLRWTPERDIECLYNQGYGGAIGFLLKITVTGYGYTFVAKGVEYERRRRLRRESRIYDHLQSQQGVSIPVHLGLIELLGGYPLMEHFKVLPYMMLLSYAGEDLSVVQQQQAWQQKTREEKANTAQEAEPVVVQGGLAPFWIPIDVNVEQEMERTTGELWLLGLRDGDSNKANALWCSETQRVMKIDFDRANFGASVALERAGVLHGVLQDILLQIRLHENAEMV